MTTLDSSDRTAALMSSSWLPVDLIESNTSERHDPLELLWFELDRPGFVITALVPVPAVTSDEAYEFARRSADVGSSISGVPVCLVDARGVTPYQTDVVGATLRQVRQLGHPTLIVTDAPTVNAGVIPVISMCPRVVLLVGLGVSRTKEISRVAKITGVSRTYGVVCLE
jgi:hypothetical protein